MQSAINGLQASLQQQVPGAELVLTPLPQAPPNKFVFAGRGLSAAPTDLSAGRGADGRAAILVFLLG